MDVQSNVFLSWSGEHSRGIAESLRCWLPLVIESPDLWISSRDLPDGRRWQKELASRLESSHFGILIVTPDNVESPWLLFEAGALSKNLESGMVLPYIVGLDKSDLSGPLAQFQAVEANEEGTRRLVETMRSILPKPPAVEVINRRFSVFWPELATALERKIGEISLQKTKEQEGVATESQGELSALRKDLIEATNLIRQLVGNWEPTKNRLFTTSSHVSASNELLNGSWLAEEDNSHLYIKTVNDVIVAPYCYCGNDELTGEYFDWRLVGDYWFARYRWFNNGINGFAFYKLESSDRLVGWWFGQEEPPEQPTFEALDKKLRDRGVIAAWRKDPALQVPQWATKHFDSYL